MTKPTFVWGLDGKPQVARSLDGLSNVVVSARWTVTGKRGDFQASRGGNQLLPPPDPQNFKPFEPATPGGPYMTDADLVAMVKAALGPVGVEAIEQEIELYIAGKEAEAADLAKPVEMALYQPPPPTAPEPAEQGEPDPGE